MTTSTPLFPVEADCSNPPFALPPDNQPRSESASPEASPPDQVLFAIPGAAVAKGRPRATRTGRMFTPAKTASAEAFIRHLATDAMANRPPMTGPVALAVEVIVPVPASWARKKKAAALAGEIHPIGRPDLDNLAKLVSDALNGVVFVDDAQVTLLMAGKQYGQHAKTNVEVTSRTVTASQLLNGDSQPGPAGS